jgi:transposase
MREYAGEEIIFRLIITVKLVYAEVRRFHSTTVKHEGMNVKMAKKTGGLRRSVKQWKHARELHAFGWGRPRK